VLQFGEGLLERPGLQSAVVEQGGQVRLVRAAI
jgi:hypothetical protein